MKQFIPGTKVKILISKEIPSLIGKIAKVDYYQDCKGKIKVSFDEKWCGYFKEYELEEVHNIIKDIEKVKCCATCGECKKLIKTDYIMKDNQYEVFTSDDVKFYCCLNNGKEVEGFTNVCNDYL